MIEEIKLALNKDLECSYIDINTEDNSHFFATIVSDKFKGMSKIKRHRTVYQCLATLMEQGLHAISMELLTAIEYKNKVS